MMNSEFRRVIFILSASAVISMSVIAAHAFDVNDLLGRNGVTTSDLGLDQYFEGECEVKANEFLNLFKEGYLKQLVQDVLDGFIQDALTYFGEIVKCEIYNLTYLGTGGAGGVNCSKDIGGAAEKALKRNFMDEVESRFIGSCTADKMRVQMGDDIRRIIQENGPDGGPAFVTDYINDLFIDPDEMGIRRFCAILANTEVCPYMRQEVFSHFGEEYGCPTSYFLNPPSLTGLGARVDGGASFLQEGQCTLPEGVTPDALDYDFTAFGGFNALQMLLEPQNNPNGFISIAETELARQRSTSVEAAKLSTYAGWRPAYGDAESSCINSVDGKCNAPGPIRLPVGGIADAHAAVIQGEFDWVINSKESADELVGDVRLRAISMIMDITAQALDYDVEIGASTQRYVDVGSGVRPVDQVTPPTPDPTPGTNPNDPLCTGGEPRCVCVRNDPNLDSSRQLLGTKIRETTIQHSDLVEPPGCTGNECRVIAGQEVQFLFALCEVAGTTFCHPNEGSVDEVVLEFPGFSVSYDLIVGGTNQLRVPPQSVAKCDPGVQ